MSSSVSTGWHGKIVLVCISLIAIMILTPRMDQILMMMTVMTKIMCHQIHDNATTITSNMRILTHHLMTTTPITTTTISCQIMMSLSQEYLTPLPLILTSQE